MGWPDLPLPPDAISLTALHLPIAGRADVERARREARAQAKTAAFSPANAEAVVLATLELATNLLRYAREGALSLVLLKGPCGTGLQVVSRDLGPGIADVRRALQDGYSTGGGLGGGLPGVRRLMDDFDLTSGPEGTCIVTRKWQRTH